jgi:oligopeptide/dipeptide ABC transporter ATP-binding protein
VALLEIQNLTLEFASGQNWVRAVEDVSLAVNAGETVCLVGESGSGKSVTALSIARLLPCPPARYPAGRILLDGRDVFTMSARDLRQVRGGAVSYIFQEPAASLNPVMRVGSQILEALELHRRQKATREETVRLLKEVGIPAPEDRVHDYPFQMSGGMQQRVMIAMALASEPKLLIADEPTTALDVTIQAQILELLRDIQQRLHMAILLITHNLGIVSEMGGRMAVMYAGQIVETGPVTEVLQNPLHPYTRALIESVPKLSEETERLDAIPGQVPHPGEWPTGCRFAPRCPIVRKECRESAPPLAADGPSRLVRCPWNKSLQPPPTA